MPRDRLPYLHLRFAQLVAQLSTCRRLQVGVVLTDPSMEQVLGYGYNGNVAGGKNECDRPEPGNCGCVHAEFNAIMKAGRGPKRAFATAGPCEACAKAYVNAGVVKLYYIPGYRNEKAGLQVLMDADMDVVGVSPEASLEG